MYNISWNIYFPNQGSYETFRKSLDNDHDVFILFVFY